MNFRPFSSLPLALCLGLASALLLSACATRSTGIRGEGSPASTGTGDTRQVAPGVSGNVNRTGTGGG